MNCYITYFIEGFIAFNEKFDLIAFNKFPLNERASKIIQLEKKELIVEEIDIIQKLQKEYENIYIESNKKKSDYSNFKNIKVQTPNPGGEYLRENLNKYLNIDSKEFCEIYREIALYKIKENSKLEDNYLIQAINSIEDIDESINKLVERIREWYALYFPEMDNIHNNETYIRLIAENETKERIMESKPEIFIDIYEDSEDVRKEDLNILNTFAKSIYELQENRRQIEEYIENKMDSIAPNLKNLVGSSLGAKLISHAGGIKRLSKYPSSTVQIMGAEKALFRHLKSGDRPPKYGLIYQHPDVRGSKWWNRGKIARLLASKISLAVRKDVYGKDDIDSNIYNDFIEKAEKIEKENPFPPTKNQRNKNKVKKSKNKSKKSKRRK